MNSNNNLTLGYWKIRGLAQPIRFLLEYCDVKFTDELYEQGDGPEFNRDCWLNVKQNLNLDFPNLPYLIHGENLKITESGAIIKYICEKFNSSLLGSTIEERAMVENLNGVLGDAKLSATIHSYRTGDANAMFNDAKNKFEGISKFLGNKKFLMGGEIRYVDFILYELIKLIDHLSKGELSKLYTNFANYTNNFEEIEQIKAYLKSDRFGNLQFNNKIAKLN